jgi:cyclophilin family peptidyl-prolyl cis-trans isomerase
MTLVFFDITIGGRRAGRITFRLFDETVPKTAQVRFVLDAN